MVPENGSQTPATKRCHALSPFQSFRSFPSLSSPDLHAQFAESAKLEQAIKANLRGLGYDE